MKKTLILSMALLSGAFAFAQTKPVIQWPDYQFTTDFEIPITPVKNQASSGTCWCFSSIGVLESDIIRVNGIKDPAKYPDLSEFFIVSHAFSDKAEKYVRMDGKMGFSDGSGAGDVWKTMDRYGLVPNSEMTGLNYGFDKPNHSELVALLKGYIDTVLGMRSKKMTTAWKRGFDAILAEYLGKYPESFTVDGKTYTPESYRDALGVKGTDYISFTSYTHHPFYKPFILEVCDNWRWSESYNLPIDEMMAVLDYALEHGVTVEWGADVSDPGFTRDGLAVLVDTEALNTNTAGSDQEHWVGKEEGRVKVIPAPKERAVSQETRQFDYDNKVVTDDHGMQIFGIAHDQFGNKYYKVKNSWGITGKYDGIWYASEAFVKNQTLDIDIHKDGVPKEVLKKLGLK